MNLVGRPAPLLIPWAQTINLSLWNENLMAGSKLMKFNLALHGPEPDGVPMPPQYNRRLSDGIISFDNLYPGTQGLECGPERKKERGPGGLIFISPEFRGRGFICPRRKGIGFFLSGKFDIFLVLQGIFNCFVHG